MTNYPVLPIIMPTDLTGQRNGYVSTAVLRTIQKPQGKLEQHAATAWNCLQLAAYFNGLTLKPGWCISSLQPTVSHVQ
jgi:hypothetical protein